MRLRQAATWRFRATGTGLYPMTITYFPASARMVAPAAPVGAPGHVPRRRGTNCFPRVAIVIASRGLGDRPHWFEPYG